MKWYKRFIILLLSSYACERSQYNTEINITYDTTRPRSFLEIYNDTDSVKMNSIKSNMDTLNSMIRTSGKMTDQIQKIQEKLNE